jgi:hypothetical protein
MQHSYFTPAVALSTVALPHAANHAIDLKDGHCVRLKQGRRQIQSTVFSRDPAYMARSWVNKGTGAAAWWT